MILKADGGYMINIDYFKAIQGCINATTKNEATVNIAKQRLTLDLTDSINYVPTSTRNLKLQPMVVIPTSLDYKSKAIAFPNEDLFVGDIIRCKNNEWLVVDTSMTNPIQTVGTMWLCNLNLKFQNSQGKTISKPAVFDTGKYNASLLKSRNSTVVTLDNKTKIYLPYDDETKYIYVDKRIAVDTRYDKDGNQILETYSITDVKKVVCGNGFYLMLTVESSTYNKNTDSIEAMICDYISPTLSSNENNPTVLQTIITGRKTIPLNSTRLYSVNYIGIDGNSVSGVNMTWSVTSNISDIKTIQNEHSISIFIPDNESYVGQKITLTATDTDNLYPTQTLEIEVVAI